jgi:hypothetical protein
VTPYGYAYYVVKGENETPEKDISRSRVQGDF